MINISCSHNKLPLRIITQNQIKEVVWSEKDLAKDIVVKLLESNKYSSIFFIRLKGSEKPHIHASHDLSVYVIKGQSSVTIENKRIVLSPGDFVTIPKGTVHWAQNIGKSPAEVIAIFSPPYKGKDKILVQQKNQK